MFFLLPGSSRLTWLKSYGVVLFPACSPLLHPSVSSPPHIFHPRFPHGSINKTARHEAARLFSHAASAVGSFFHPPRALIAAEDLLFWNGLQLWKPFILPTLEFDSFSVDVLRSEREHAGFDVEEQGEAGQTWDERSDLQEVLDGICVVGGEVHLFGLYDDLWPLNDPYYCQ